MYCLNKNVHDFLVPLQDHIVQSHPLILTQLALVYQKAINTYSSNSPGAAVGETYRDGDLFDFLDVTLTLSGAASLRWSHITAQEG